MILNNIKTIVAFIVGLLLCFLTMKQCSSPSTSEDLNIKTGDKNVSVKLTTKVIYKDTVIYKIKEVVIKEPTRTDTVFIDNTKIIASIPAIRRTYQDSVKMQDSVTVGYTAKTTGTLDNLSLTFRDSRAEKTIVRNTETTITNQPKGLYLGIGSNVGLTELSPSIMYLSNKNSYGIKYDLASKQNIGIQRLGITYARRIL